MASNSPEASGRTMPAQSPLAPSVSPLTTNAVEALNAMIADVAVQPTPDAAAETAPTSPLAQAPAIAPSAGQTRLTVAPTNSTADEEQVLLSVLRLIDRIVSPGTLSPVERAFVAGAKVMFDHLSKECDKMLRRKVSDLTASQADPSIHPSSTGNEQPPPPKIQTTRRTKKKPSQGDA